jgi:hypothetical protein
VSPATYTNYVSSSPKQQKKTIMQTMQQSTSKSTNQGATAKRRRRKFTYPPESGELSYRLSITVRRYPPTQEEEDLAQEIPETALVAAQAYLLTTQPGPGDPWEHMHRAAIKSLGLVENRLRKHSPEKKSTRYEDKGKKNTKYQSSQSQTNDSSGDEKRSARREDARNIIAQTRVNNARYAWKEEDYEDDEKEMGALCFT